MHLHRALLAVPLLRSSLATPVADHGEYTRSQLQTPLAGSKIILNPAYLETQTEHQRLHGKFLHITDIHPDLHYIAGSSTNEEHDCHRGKGAAGPYGAETTDCDTPFTLVNATFRWIEENVRDEIDFVIWTGDSARHDEDERIPRTHDEVLNTNRKVANKFVELFHEDESGQRKRIPVVPTFGNNDILPHNILLAGPNKWLKAYHDIWSDFIPEEQRHGFERGGWFYQEVIPNKLAVFSLNTLYFFSNNAGVDGCEMESEPGYEHMEWLRIQLQFIRHRNMKAMLIGHVPPARTDSKRLWDESCWQMYTLWLQQYRDIVVGGFFGHMNIDHFMLQDTKDIDLKATQGNRERVRKDSEQPEFHLESASSYLNELREGWIELPNPLLAEEDVVNTRGKKERKRRKEVLKKMGGPWAERFQITHVSPSVVPNYFPTLRLFSYNTSGLEADTAEVSTWYEDTPTTHNQKKGKKPDKHRPTVTIPSPPSENAPPGPAYSPQTFSLLGYTQYFANLTWINALENEEEDGNNHTQFAYEVEYNTFTDPVYKLKDLTVKSWLRLAHRIGKHGADGTVNDSEEVEMQGKHKKKKGKRNKLWLEFVRRAFVGTIEEKKMRKFAYEGVGLTDDDLSGIEEDVSEEEIPWL